MNAQTQLGFTQNIEYSPPTPVEMLSAMVYSDQFTQDGYAQ